MGPFGSAARSGTPTTVHAISLSVAAVIAVGFLAVLPDPAAAVTQYKKVAAGSGASCGITVASTVNCWGTGFIDESGAVASKGSTDFLYGAPRGTMLTKPVTVQGLSDVVAIGIGGAPYGYVTTGHGCAVLSGGSVKCWGWDLAAQLGFEPACHPDSVDMYGNPIDCYAMPANCDCLHPPTTVAGISSAVAVAVGTEHSCALLSGGTVTCWGNNYWGAVGDGTTRLSPCLNKGYNWCYEPTLPTEVNGLSGATQISAVGGSTCARLSWGQVKCWGSNSDGELGSATSDLNQHSLPVPIPGIWNAKHVDVGEQGACATLDDGTVKCWGRNRLVNKTPETDLSGPTTISGVTKADSVAVGGANGCALLTTRRLNCWGYGYGASAGSGAGQDQPPQFDVSGLASVTQLDGRSDGYCARLTFGRLRCWGDNRYGHLGDGTTTDRLAPVAVFDTPTDESDTDGDGLPDGWETDPVDLTGDGKADLDLPRMGADPEHKDLFVEVDAMANLRMSQDAIDAVVKAFDDAPVPNPDGETGIRLHVDNGPSSVMNPLTGETWGSLSRANQIPWKAVLGTGTYSASGGLTDYGWSEFDSVKAANFDPMRARAFRYALSVNRYAKSTELSGGLAREIPSTDFFVSLGAWCRPEGRCLPGTLAQAAVFMHELGHTLGLRHGGNEEVNNKPNYLSVMNYLFNATGLLRSDLPRGQGVLDYSRFGPSDLPDVNENAVSESAGFSSSPSLANYRTIVFLSDLVPASGPIDFNGDGDTTDVEILNLNKDLIENPNLPGSGEMIWDMRTLTTFADWPNLKYQAGGIGSAGAAPSLPMTTEANEPSMELLMKFANLSAAPPVVKTMSATSITQTGARLNATVNPTGQPTEVQFTYATTSTDTKLTPFTNAGKGTTTIPFNRTITGLVGDTTYTVRAVARTGTQLVYGSTVTFKTAACSKLTTRSKRQSCVLAREQYRCNQLTSTTQRMACLKAATTTAGRTR